jgi:hypothetical protein
MCSFPTFKTVVKLTRIRSSFFKRAKLGQEIHSLHALVIKQVERLGGKRHRSLQYSFR